MAQILPLLQYDTVPIFLIVFAADRYGSVAPEADVFVAFLFASV